MIAKWIACGRDGFHCLHRHVGDVRHVNENPVIGLSSDWYWRQPNFMNIDAWTTYFAWFAAHRLLFRHSVGTLPLSWCWWWGLLQVLFLLPDYSSISFTVRASKTYSVSENRWWMLFLFFDRRRARTSERFLRYYSPRSCGRRVAPDFTTRRASSCTYSGWTCDANSD